MLHAKILFVHMIHSVVKINGILFVSTKLTQTKTVNHNRHHIVALKLMLLLDVKMLLAKTLYAHTTHSAVILHGILFV